MADTKTSSDALPHAARTARVELTNIGNDLVENALTQALPVPDIMFGGAVMLSVIMFHAFWIRFITSTYLKRSMVIQKIASVWRADLLFTLMLMLLLMLHLAEVLIWSAALIFADIVRDWSGAAYFAANCYTALGEPFQLPRAWRIVPPIIAISGIFTFAWTASVLVNFVARYNELRAGILGQPPQE